MKDQNWVRLEGEWLVFPGGGTSFPHGVKWYAEELVRLVLQLGKGGIRIDIGCGVVSFGAQLLDYDALTLSVAPRDSHEPQVQFALEHGLPAMLGVLSSFRLLYPSRSFDMGHCARCLIKSAGYGGNYLLEIDRVLRPGGYWVLSEPPINWKTMYKGWKRTLGSGTERNRGSCRKKLCWKKVVEKGPFAIWRKPTNHIHCAKSPRFCNLRRSLKEYVRMLLGEQLFSLSTWWCSHYPLGVYIRLKLVVASFCFQPNGGPPLPKIKKCNHDRFAN